MNIPMLEASLRSELPLVEVGVYQALAPLTEPGARLLLTAHGLMLESCNGVYRAVSSLGKLSTAMRLPYGAVQEGVTPLDHAAIQATIGFARDFLVQAQEQAPNETMMLVVKAPGRAARRILPSFNETPNHLNYLDRAHMQDDERIILDIHSHGYAPAFFSEVDDIDDQRFHGDLKITCVVGRCDRPIFEQAQRWVSRGHIFYQSGQMLVRVGGDTPC